MSDSVRPHRQQPTRLPHPWDSPGKNTGVGCPFLLQCMRVKSESEVALSCLTPSDPVGCVRPWDFPGKSTGVGCHCLTRDQAHVSYSVCMESKPLEVKEVPITILWSLFPAKVAVPHGQGFRAVLPGLNSPESLTVPGV